MERLSNPSRRAFLKKALSLLGALWVPSRARALGSLPTRPLGQTGLEPTILGFGGFDIGRLPQAQAVSVVEAVLEEGINYIDTASSYYSSEAWIGRALRGVDRSGLIIATKVLKRSRDEARREIERSLKRLGTDRVDLLQIHAVNSTWVLRRVLSRDGALAAALEFKEAGHVDHIGITGHRRPEVLVKALGLWPFATALIPVSPADSLYHDFAGPLEREAVARGVGLMAMKVLADGALASRARDCIAYALSRPVACAVVGMGSVREVRANAAYVRAFRPMDQAEKNRLEEAFRPLANSSVLWWKK